MMAGQQRAQRLLEGSKLLQDYERREMSVIAWRLNSMRGGSSYSPVYAFDTSVEIELHRNVLIESSRSLRSMYIHTICMIRVDF